MPAGVTFIPIAAKLATESCAGTRGIADASTLDSANTALHLCFHHSSLLCVRPRDRSFDQQTLHAAAGQLRTYGSTSICRLT